MASKANARQKAGIEAGLKMKTTSVGHIGGYKHTRALFVQSLLRVLLAHVRELSHPAHR